MKFKTLKVPKEHIVSAIEQFLKGMSIINDNEVVDEVSGTGTHYTVIVKKEDR